MMKCDFNKIILKLYWNHTSACISSCKFAVFFQKTFLWEHVWRAASVKCYYSVNFIRSNFQVARKGRFVTKPKYLGDGTMVPTRGKILDFRFPESPKNELSRTFCSPKSSLQSWIFHCLFENFREYLRDIPLAISIIVYSVPQHFSWFKNYKLYWFSDSFLVLLLRVPKQFVL